MAIDLTENITNKTLYANQTAKNVTALVPHGGEQAKQSGALAFGDILDSINPLQHIPVVSTIYRSATGDVISSAARIAGGGIFGGVLGVAGSVVNSIIEASTGKDAGEHILSLFDDEKEEVTTDNVLYQPFNSPLKADNGSAFISIASDITPKTNPESDTPKASEIDIKDKNI